MKKLDWFLVKSFIGPFFGILIVVVFILMMQFLWLYIDELVGKGLSLKVILEFLGWGSATLLPLALPLATLLASVMTIGQMSENNELLAMKSAGIPLTRIILPLTICAILICTGAFFSSNNLVPLAYNKIYTLRDDIGKTKEEINIPTGTFYNGIDGYALRIESRDEKTGMLHGIILYDHTGNKGNTSITLADSAEMRMSKAKDYLIFKLYNGVNYQENNEMSYRDTTLQLQKINFSRQEMIIPLVNYAFEKSDEARFGDQVMAKGLIRLRRDKDSLNTLNDSARVEHYADFMRKRTLRYSNQLDTSAHFTAASKFDFGGKMEWPSLESEIGSYERAVNVANDYETTMYSYSNDVYSYLYILRRTDVGLLKKFADAFACLIFFLIGAPIGSFIRKSKLGSGAIIAVLFFVLYWVIDLTGNKLAKDGATSAAIGVFVSALVLAPIGIFLLYKAVKDSALFNTDNFGEWFRKVKTKFMSIFRKTRIVYMGTPEFAIAPLEALMREKYNIVGVVTVADKPVGRGQKLGESAVKKFALEHNIPVLQPLKLKDPEFLGSLAALKADLFVVVAFRMLPEEVWNMPKLGTFNLHAALLPQYRGAAPINWAIINGENMTGVTTFKIDKNIDTGGIVLRQECRISETDTAGDLHDKLMPLGAELVAQTVEGVIERNMELRVQRSFIQGSEVLKPAPKLTKELCHIDWDDSVVNVYNLIRGLSPYPAAYTELQPKVASASVTIQNGAATGKKDTITEYDAVHGENDATTGENGAATGKNDSQTVQKEAIQMKIFKSEKVSAEQFEVMKKTAGAGTCEVGDIVSDGKNFFAIACKDGAVSVLDLQLSGKKRMDVKAFLAGFRNPQSYVTTRGTSKEEIAKTKVQTD